MARYSPLLFLAPILALLAVGCPGQKPPAGPQSSKPSPGADGPLVWKLSKSGLGFRISNADEEADRPSERKVAPATPLGADDARKMAARLPELKRDPDDEKDFAMRAKSIPAPRPGTTVSEVFPPPAGPPPVNAPPSGPLKVERHAPEGKVDLAPHLTMTFTQPMVAVTAVDEVNKEHPPVRLVPEPPGKWRWLGTRTLMFQPEKRFPMATEYAVEVPAGTRATNGQTLAVPARWTFTTPPPVMKSSYPRGTSEPLDPLLFAEFDQAVEPRAMLGFVELTAGGSTVPIKLAEADEIEANDAVRRLSQQAEKGRWIAFRPVNKLSTSTSLTVRIKPGAPSAEGPKTTDKEQSFSFSTYGAMRVTHHSCSYWSRSGKEQCPPLAPFSISFSNPVDMKTFDKDEMVKVSPEIPGMKLEVHGSGMSIRGKTKGRTKYAVTIDGAIGDTHGQKMGRPETLTFDVGPAEPTMFGAEQEMIVLEPPTPAARVGGGEGNIRSSKTYQVYTINEPGLRARVYAVTPDDWAKYGAFRQEWERPRKLAAPGRLVYDKVITPKQVPDELVATPIDLGPALTGGLGQVLVVVEPTRALPKGHHRPELHVWVQSTELGLDAMIENDQVTGWATRLADGAPEGGVEVSLLGAGSSKTDSQGLARIPLSASPGRLIVGKKGKDVVIVPERWFGEPSYHRVTHPDSVRWLVYDDRGMYKPGEEARVKGWVRRAGMSREGDIDAIPNIAGKTVRYRVRDPRWAEIGSGTTTVDELGGFDLTFKLPGNANLGHAQIELDLEGVSLEGTRARHAFQVQEFRRPEFEVTARSSEGPHFVGKHAITTLNAAYYSGGGLPDAPVEWRVTRSTVGFTPPNRSEYHFGPEPHYFWSSRHGKMPETKTETWSSKTNPQGIHRIRLDFDAVEPSYPMSLDILGQVTDVNRQQWAGRTSMIVHPSDMYSGIKLAKNFIRAGENIEAEIAVVDVDGNPLPGRHVVVKAARIDSEQKGTEWEERELETQTCEVTAPPAGSSDKLRCSFKTQQGGSWRVWSIVTDEHGRKNQTTTSLWVIGADRPKDRGLDRARVNLVLDKKEYKPGDLAEVLVVAPFAPAEALLTVRRQGIVHVERFSMAASSQAIKVKLEEAFVPNVEIRVDLVGRDVRENDAGSPDERLPKRPAFASGSAQGAILPTTRTLDVKAAAKKPTLEPGGSTQIDIDVKDHTGRGVPNAEVALVVADEAVLALSGYKTPDPLAVFYSHRSSDVQELGMRDRVLLGEPDLTKLRALETLDEGGAPGGFGGGRAYAKRAATADFDGAPPPPPSPMSAPTMAAQPAKPKAGLKNDAAAEREESAAADTKSVVGDTKTPMQVRTDFSALAVFSPAVKTDAQGRATVPVKLPDNLTRYRVMAVAATKDRSFGSNRSPKLRNRGAEGRTMTGRRAVIVDSFEPKLRSFVAATAITR